MDLEFALGERQESTAYPFVLEGTSFPLVIDWRPAMRELLADQATGGSVAAASAKFHNMLVETIITVAQRLAVGRVVLSGGCFQNQYLLEKSSRRLEHEGFRAYWPQRVPPNDGGICLGQVVAARLWNL
jgi:hydrogenase maturation protein HypF